MLHSVAIIRWRIWRLWGWQNVKDYWQFFCWKYIGINVISTWQEGWEHSIILTVPEVGFSSGFVALQKSVARNREENAVKIYSKRISSNAVTPHYKGVLLIESGESHENRWWRRYWLVISLSKYFWSEKGSHYMCDPYLFILFRFCVIPYEIKHWLHSFCYFISW